MLYPLSYEGLDCERPGQGGRSTVPVVGRLLVVPLACHNEVADAQLASRERTGHSGSTTAAISSAISSMVLSAVRSATLSANDGL